jgi:hypothetical protein
VRSGEDGFVPVEVTVESRLLGPFPSPIEQAPAVPADAPEVCTVLTTVSGTGDYDTPECTVPASGYYVWVERIDPGAVAPGHGGERVREWQSPFGVAEEVTRVVEPTVTHVVPTPTPAVTVPPAAPSQPAVIAEAPITELAETGSEMSALPMWIAVGSMATGCALLPAGLRRRSSTNRRLGDGLRLRSTGAGSAQVRGRAS